MVLHCDESVSSSGRSRKTVFRSIRLTENLDEILAKDAKANNLSFNALVSMILSKYAEWDRFAGRYGFVSITRDGFRSIQESVEQERRVKLAQELGARNPKEMVSFWFKKVSFDNLLTWLSMYCRYGRLAEFELEMNGPEYAITLRHELGREYSEFLGHYVDQAIRSMEETTPHLDISENSVAVRFTLPQSRRDSKASTQFA
jgi:hypothetical protein